MGILDSDAAAGLMQIPVSEEPGMDNAVSGSKHGIYIGNSQKYLRPFFLDMDAAINPHILICGITGGGKTFLARSIVARLHLFSESSIIAVDFTGEYGASLLIVHDGDTHIDSLFSESERPRIAYFDFHKLSEHEKVARASELLDRIAVAMRRRKPGQKRKVFVLLDEAWKLIGKNKGLEIIIREGRKYGVGLITSSQLLHDTSSTILSNVASVFVFRTTDAKSLDRLAGSYELQDKHLAVIKNLELGSCLAMIAYKSGFRSVFQIRKVAGILNVETMTIKDGMMEIKVDMQEFDAFLDSLCGMEKGRALRASLRGTVALPMLICKLMEAGAERSGILMGLHKMGFTYADIADSFAIAISRLGDRYARKS